MSCVRPAFSGGITKRGEQVESETRFPYFIKRSISSANIRCLDFADFFMLKKM